MTHGLQLEDLLRFTVTRGLVRIEGQDGDTWVGGLLGARQTPRRDVVRTAEGRWLAIDIGPANGGEVIMLYSDVTEQHEAEIAAGQLTARNDARAQRLICCVEPSRSLGAPTRSTPPRLRCRPWSANGADGRWLSPIASTPVAGWL